LSKTFIKVFGFSGFAQKAGVSLTYIILTKFQKYIMEKINDKELIEKAKSVVKPIKIRHGFTAGDCGCALVTDKGNVYLGVCIDTCSGMGFCAEHSAIAAMVTNGERVIKKIVAVSEKGISGPPCGRCREFMRQIHEENMNADVIIGENKVVKLKDLLPHPWDE
jgi:cytidine deaminase